MSSHRHAIGVTRRELVQVGYSGLLGVGLAGLTPTTAAAAVPSNRPKSVLLVFLTGAASHVDTFDPKPDAPAEVRGEFGTHPHQDAGHPVRRAAARAGRPERPVRGGADARAQGQQPHGRHAPRHHRGGPAGVRFDKPLSRDDWPCYAAGVSYLRPPADGVPAG